MDVSNINRRVRDEVEKRGLVLRVLEPKFPGDIEALQVCERASDGILDGVGHVAGGMGGGPPFVAFARNRQRWSNDEIALGLMTWEAGVLAVLAAYDRE